MTERGRMPRKAKPAIKRDRNGLIRCRVCSCTEIEPCNPPCFWQGEGDICSHCYDLAFSLRLWTQGANRASKAALFREVEAMDRRCNETLEAAHKNRLRRLANRARHPRGVKQVATTR